MSLSSSLNAGVAGLSANATRLAVISDNIANTSTNGYRRADVDFSALVSAQSSGYTAGGVKAQQIRNVQAGGATLSTGNSTDISISGRGFLPVTTAAAIDQDPSERPFQLLPTGSFSPNEDGFLVTPSGLALLGWETAADGSLLTAVNRNGPNDLTPIRIPSAPTAGEPTTELTLGVNLPATATDDGADGLPFESTIEYFDGVGRSATLRVVYTPTLPVAPSIVSTNEWTLTIFDNATSTTTPVAELELTFDGSRTGQGQLLSADLDATTPIGNAYDTTTGIVVIDTIDGPIDFFLGGPGLDGGLTQLAAEFAPTSIIKNGTPAGTLSSVEIDENGFLQGVFDSGQKRVLYQIPLVDVPNANGLTALDDQAFKVSSESGPVFLWDANSGPVGGVVGFSLQQSAVDVARELTDLIQTQRAYSSNASVIRTVDEMLQETTNLKR